MYQADTTHLKRDCHNCPSYEVFDWSFRQKYHESAFKKSSI